MVKPIVKDIEFLQQKSEKADLNAEETKIVIRDLLDTANEYAESKSCVGLSAIQIGVPLRVCVVYNGQEFVPFVNPIIVGKHGNKYQAEEGCMSLDGTRIVERYEKVTVMRRGSKGYIKETYKGFMAQIIQHELDHFDGKLI